jgi:hypothetical protein
MIVSCSRAVTSRAPRGTVLGGRIEAGDEAGDARELQPIENLLATPLTGDDASAAQDLEVFRGRGPAEADRVD